MWFLFEEVSSSSWCLEWAALFYCGTPWTFDIIIPHSCFMTGYVNKCITCVCWFRTSYLMSSLAIICVNRFSNYNEDFSKNT